MRAAATATVATMALVFAAIWFFGPIDVGGDTRTLMDGTEVAARCIEDGVFRNCGALEDQPFTAVWHYPVLQYVPDLIVHELGFGRSVRERVLGGLSTVAFIGSIALAARTGRRLGVPASGVAFALVAASGPLLVYAHSTFGEMLASFLMVWLVSTTVLVDRPWVVAAAALFATLTKETAAPFVLAFGAVGLALAVRRTAARVRPHAIALVGGTVLGAASAMAFNVFRFGGPFNDLYHYVQERGPDPIQVGRFMGGLLLAPNGGIAIWWPSATVLLCLAVVLPLTLWRREPDVPVWPALAIAAIGGAQLVGLANWFIPYGWWAWGPRLTLPWIAPLVLVALAAYGGPLTLAVARAVRSGAGAIGAGMLVGATALPQAGFLLRTDRTMLEIFPVGEVVARWSRAETWGTPAFYRFVDDVAWTRRPALWIALEGLASVPGVLLGAVLVAGCGGLMWWWRRLALAPVTAGGGSPEERSTPADAGIAVEPQRSPH